jgi:glyoxylase-like metal-dependent hydrolase (beta-lactamase superfamily II)
MNPTIHTYTSKEPMLKVNAFIIEAEKHLIIVDTTLTMSDSKSLKQKADDLRKPIAGIVLTHGHPDHVAGTYNISRNGEVPIYAIASVKNLMEETEQMKHQQWSGMFGKEWVPKWVYPNTIVKDGEEIVIGGLNFKVIDTGAGGDCDANSIWLMNGENAEDKVAFVGDFLYNKNHTYMADGSILRWLGNLEKYAPILKGYATYYIGHGPQCSYEDIARQKNYFLTYCSEVLKSTHGTGVFSDESKKSFEQVMFSLYPDYGCQFMVGLSADRVAHELMGSKA